LVGLDGSVSSAPSGTAVTGRCTILKATGGSPKCPIRSGRSLGWRCRGDGGRGVAGWGDPCSTRGASNAPRSRLDPGPPGANCSAQSVLPHPTKRRSDISSRSNMTSTDVDASVRARQPLRTRRRRPVPMDRSSRDDTVAGVGPAQDPTLRAARLTTILTGRATPAFRGRGTLDEDR